MKLSNFKVEKTIGGDMCPGWFASIDVETGVLFWKKKESRQIFSSNFKHWVFVDTADLIPFFKIRPALLCWLSSESMKH